MSDNSIKNNNFIAQGTILALASIICRIIGLCYRIPLTNILGNVGNGFYGYAFEVYNIALLLSSFSLPLAISKLMAERIEKKEYGNANKVFRCSLVFAVAIGLIVSLLIFIFAPAISSDIIGAPMSKYALMVLSPCILIVAIMGVFRGFFQGFGSMVQTSISQIIEQIFNAIVSIVAASLLFDLGLKLSKNKKDLLAPALGASGGTLGTVIGALAGLTILLILYFRYKKNTSNYISMKSSVSESYLSIFKLLILTIIPIILSSAMFNLLTILDPSIFNHFMRSHGYNQREYTALFGMYSGKYMQLANIPISIANAVAVACVPALNYSLVDKNYNDIYTKINKSVKYAMLVAIPCFFGFIFLGRGVLTLLWNDNSDIMYYIVVAGSMQMLLYSLSTVTNVTLQGLGYTLLPVKNAIISLVVHIISLVLLLNVAKIDIYAIPISGMVFALCMCILNYIDLYKKIGYKPEFLITYIKPFVVSFVMGILIFILNYLFANLINYKVLTVLILMISIIFYVILIIKCKIINEEDITDLPLGNKFLKLLKKVKVL